MQSNDNFQRNHQEQLDEDLAESNVEDAGVGARLAPNLKMFKSRKIVKIFQLIKFLHSSKLLEAVI